jgi:hypothetical protein
VVSDGSESLIVCGNSPFFRKESNPEWGKMFFFLKKMIGKLSRFSDPKKAAFSSASTGIGAQGQPQSIAEGHEEFA